MASIDDADMYGNLTRVAMAKMVANYVLDLGLQELDTTKECKFPDVSVALDTAYDNGVTKACQLGLMGVGITKFNPNGIVTRAEFGTVLSRALWGDENNGGDPYYKKHLQALKDEGIMNMIDNPNMKEVRGYVMLMMMRADDNYSPATGCSAEELLACLIGDDYESCIAACSEDEVKEPVKPGSATVSRVGSVETQTVEHDAYQKNVGTIKLTAGSNGATVSSVVVSRDGLSDFGPNTVMVKLKGGNIETAEKGVSKSSNSATVKFTPSIKLAAGESQNFDVIVTLNDSGDTNATHNFKVTEVNVSNGSASGTPINLGTLKTTTAKSKSVQVDINNVDTSIKAGDKAKTLAEVEFNFNDVAGKVDGFTLNVSGSTNDDFFEVFNNAAAYIGNDKVGTVGLAKDKIVVSGLNKSVAKNDFVKVKIKADAIYAKKEYKFDLNISSIDVNGLRPQIGYDNLINKTITVAGSDLKFTRIKSIDSIVPGTSNVKVFEGEFTTANDVIIDNFTINNRISRSTGDITGAVVDNTARIIINGESFELSAADLANGTSAVNAQVEVLAGQKAKVEIVLNTKRNATGADAFQYEVELNNIVSADDTSVEYAAQKKVTGTKVSLKAGDFTLTNLTASAGNDTISTDELGQEIGRFSVRAKNDNMKLTTLTGSLPGSSLTGGDTLEDVVGQSIDLYVEGQENPISASLTMNGDDFELRDMDYVITKDTTVRFVLVADFGDVKDYVDANNTINLNITVTAEDTNSASTVNTKTLGTYTFTEAKPVVSLTNGSNSKVFTIGLDNSKNDDVTLSGIALYIEGSQSGYTGVACLSNDSSTAICTAPGVVATGTVINGTSTTFTINSSSERVLGVKEYYLILPAVSNENDVRVVVDTITIVEGGATFHYGNIEATYKNY